MVGKNIWESLKPSTSIYKNGKNFRGNLRRMSLTWTGKNGVVAFLMTSTCLSLYGLSRRWISVITDYQEVYHIMTELSASVQDMALLFKVINLSLGTWHVVSDN